MSSRKATESFCFVHTTQYIYEEDNKGALERLGRQATFKFRALWSVRDGKGLLLFHHKKCMYFEFSYVLIWEKTGISMSRHNTMSVWQNLQEMRKYIITASN